MRIETLHIRRFRAIHDMDLELHPKTNVLIGENGAGKTSVLDCLAVMLSHVTNRIISPKKPKEEEFHEDDITTGQKSTVNTVRAYFNGQQVSWKAVKSHGSRKEEEKSSFAELNAAVDSFLTSLETIPETILPLIVYYTTNRAVLDIPERIRTKHEFDRLSVYEEALFPSQKKNRLDFRLFFEWFKNREDIENEENVVPRDETEHKVFEEDPMLKAVRNAITAFLPGFEDLRIRRTPKIRMALIKGSHELAVDQLSDGEKCLLALVGDLARRLAVANPDMENPLEGEGIVLIDEIELHLHPAWQRMILPALEKTFPKCQFIVTTHSPQVLSHVKPEKVFILKESEEGIVVARPEATYGQTSNRILEDVMGVPARPEEAKRNLDTLFSLIDQGNIQKARDLLREIRSKIGEDPDLIEANLFIRRKEIIGR